MPAAGRAPTIPSTVPATPTPQQARFRRVLCAFGLYTLAVILWGAYVRSSLSGDGCGAHWPLCNGQVLPVEPQLKTVVEFTHRVTSGLCWVGSFALWWWSRRVFPKGHRARLGALLVFVFMCSEALVGAGLVLLQLVATNPSGARAYWMGAHLLNTFLLLGSLALGWFWAGGGGSLRAARRSASGKLLLGGVAAFLLLGMSGAIVALGDTLYPAQSLAAGIAHDLSASAPLFVRLRVVHPVLALALGVYLMTVASAVATRTGDPSVRRLAWTIGGLYTLQIAAGFANMMLLAPIWLQLVHLAIADAIWVSLLLFVAYSSAASATEARVSDAEAAALPRPA